MSQLYVHENFVNVQLLVHKYHTNADAIGIHTQNSMSPSL